MFETLSFNKKQIYPVLVVGSMSSGKSTLINVIIGRELMPSANRACTAKALAVLDNDAKPRFVIHMVKADGTYCLRENAIEKAVAEFHETDQVEEMIIEGNILGIRNNQKALLLIDTPGINYCMDQSHERVTKEVLDEFGEGCILHIMNAHQVGTSDEINVLKMTAKKIKENPKFKVIFVINKMDTLDPLKEKPCELVENCRKVIQGLEIGEPLLLPISAGSALSFKKVINRSPLPLLLTDIEEFERSYKRFKRGGFSLLDYVDIPGRRNRSEILTVGNEKYTRAEIYAALDNTGLPFLERELDKILSEFPKAEEPKVTVKKGAERKARRAEQQEKRMEKKQLKEKEKMDRKTEKEKEQRRQKNGKGSDQI